MRTKFEITGKRNLATANKKISILENKISLMEKFLNPTFEVIDENKQIFLGRVYYRNKKGYYLSKGQRLHINVWKYFHGEVPEGCVIHHNSKKNGEFDKDANNIEDLICLTNAEHTKIHYLDKIEQKFIRKCLWCGKKFTTQNFNSKYCSEECHKEMKRSKPRPMEERVCKMCGKKFLVRKDSKTQNCSVKCGWAFRKLNLQKKFDDEEKN